MSRTKKTQEAPAVEASAVAPAPVVATPMTPPVIAANPKITDEDKAVLELAKARRETVLAQAKEAAAKAENADLSYRYIVLQIYHKYGLSSNDALTENGEIVRGGANQQAK